MNASTIVAHPYQMDSAVLYGNIDLRGSTIETVLEQLFGDGCRTFDHLAGGDLIRDVREQNPNAGG